MAKQLKPYMAYSRAYGPCEGAILVIANSVREAKKLAWGYCLNVDDWTDQGIKLIKDKSILILSDQEKLARKDAHVIECPEHCESCQLWGCGLTDDNLCTNCNCHPGNKLLELYKQNLANEV